MYILQWLLGYNRMTMPGDVNFWNSLAGHAVFGVPVSIATAAFVNTYFYKKTRSVWAGAIIAAMITCVTAVMNNSINYY